MIWCSPYSFYRVPRDCERWSDVPLVPSTEFHVIVNDNLMVNLFLLQSSTWLWTIIWCSTCSFYRVSRDCERWSDVTLVLSTEHSDRWSDIPLVPSTDQHVIVNGDLMFPLSSPLFLHKEPRDCERRSEVPPFPSTECPRESTTWLWTAIWCSPFSFHRVPHDRKRWSDVPEYHVIWRSPCSFHRVPRNLMFSLFLPQSALSVPIPQQPPPSPEPSQASQPPPPLLKPSIKIPTARTESKTNSTAGSDVSKKSVPSTRPCAKRAKPDPKRPAKKPPAGQTAALRPNMDAKTRPKSVNIQQPTPRDTHRWVT